jgi:hypothetical protein
VSPPRSPSRRIERSSARAARYGCLICWRFKTDFAAISKCCATVSCCVLAMYA